jgi:hypothetical protein
MECIVRSVYTRVIQKTNFMKNKIYSILCFKDQVSSFYVYTK